MKKKVKTFATEIISEQKKEVILYKGLTIGFFIINIILIVFIILLFKN